MHVNGQIIKSKRESLGISQEALAIAADRGARWVQEVEKGNLVNINRHIAAALARHLKCKLEDIAKTPENLP